MHFSQDGTYGMYFESCTFFGKLEQLWNVEALEKKDSMPRPIPIRLLSICDSEDKVRLSLPNWLSNGVYSLYAHLSR